MNNQDQKKIQGQAKVSAVAGFVKNTPSNYSVIDPFTPARSGSHGSMKYWRWGEDNLFPYALSLLYRRSTAHRRIINDKADYISGRGIICDEKNKPLHAFILSANGSGHTLREVLNRAAKDKCLLGNAFIEVVTDRKRSFVSVFHQDATRCRLSKDKKHIILHHNWAEYNEPEARRLSLFPNFEDAEDGTLRSIIHYKDYEPMFENYGVPVYIAGLGVSTIAYKTDKWNISRLDNSFQLSGVMVLDSTVDSEEEAQKIIQEATSRFAGVPGQIMWLMKNGNDNGDQSKFIPIKSDNDGDWDKLHTQATSDIVVAHSWFRTLSGLDYATGLSSDKILNEYQIALNTIIQPEQAELLEPIKQVLSIANIDVSSLEVVNRPPIVEKPKYMKIWEARKADGLSFDENDPAQQAFLASLKDTGNERTNNG